ncbi:Tryptophan synthase beta chain like [Paramagnetospirillum magnetotacticum MS-1]|uniref:Tryptophan synthase beta chain like n=1 Tax=Paramagnetospirillum magnetotacticum MS-1 TaxID=272627 RepID=A0A0C2YDA0_PARME|nr:WbuC family cupin fold metalloprotein [Paramagnetospirillum magnetotacticum]KIL97674.1 Tryptophan synthase beta chain like [Paramagnetospirillum magnetotacticum MS-1]
MKLIHSRDLAELSAQAAMGPRRRLNINLHPDASDPVQRMVIAFEPETYIRPHRHPVQFETFIWLGGWARLLSFTDDGRVDAIIDLAGDAARVVEIPPGTWHSLVSLAEGTRMVEVKPGPYRPTMEADFAAWAPPEGHGEASACRDWMSACLAGQAHNYRA